MTNQNESYDIVILNGRVMDAETRLDAVPNVGVKGGTIGIITAQSIQGKEIIDATGHLIARFLQDNGVKQMAYKGRIQVDADADITVFNPKTVRDNSTIVLLVSGSIGFRGLAAMAVGQAATGEQQFVQMFVVGLTIAAGLFVGNTIIPTRATL